MPYDNELAKYHVIRRIAESDQVKNFLNRCKINDSAHSEFELPSSPTNLARAEWLPKWIIAIDGGNQEIPVENGFPGAEVSYISIASVMIDVELLQKLDAERPVDPAAFRKIQSTDADANVFPGCNVNIEGEISSQASLRRQLKEVMEEGHLSADGESILDTYQALLKYKSEERPQNCPYDDCEKLGATYKRGDGEYKCDCRLLRSLYSTDALRIHEGMEPGGSNGAMFSEVRQVMERIWLIHILHTLENKGWLSSLKKIVFVIDGPLAVFGHPAWLKDAIAKELQRINKLARETNDEDLFILGIEKTGAFADHLIALDINKDGSPGRIEPGTVMLLDDGYIKRNIIFSESERWYGDQTYFGRKFFYKTKTGALIVGMTPFYDDEHSRLNKKNVSQFPRLSDALSLLDKLVSSRYPNAVVPLVEANAEAAIPMRLGTRVLEKLAKELMGKGG
ncbi:MAG: DNA double-strand break repair nuclease NurA [Candidatus Thiodiazotropha sp. (ex Epidulcina cf. delphinae)]|nr:DNA double-strand break repair nuclease NurA [Candidatus Thiodiazotropha sp. (ex Epidulcina cf. delphinae)]